DGISCNLRGELVDLDARNRYFISKANSHLRLAFFLALLAFAASLAAQPLPPAHADNFTGHPRVVVISDIGNEPDDQMSIVRLMLYSNELDLEALIASTSTWQKTATPPETMHAIVQAYRQ